MALTASQIAERLLKKVQGVADTKFPLTVRSVLEEATSTYNLVTPANIWTQANDIPSTPPVLTPVGGSASSGVVSYYEKLLLVPNDAGSVNSFRAPGGELADAISGRFGFGYNFKVYNTSGTQQVFKGDWLVDSESGIITFYNMSETLNESPSVTINNANPPRITFYKYIGTKGFGSGSGVGTILGVTAGSGLNGGGTAGYITLDVNLGIDSGLTFSGDNIILDTNIAGNGLDFSSGVLTVNISEINSGLAGNGLTANGSTLDVNVNSDSLEIVNDVIRLKDTITGDRIFQNDLTVGGDVFIQGSFSVAGSASSINTVSLVVSDPIIALGHSQSGPPLLDEGLMFVRGTGVTQAFIWDESDDTFALISTNDDHTLIGNVDILGYSNLRLGGLSASQIEITSGAQQDYVLVSDQNGLASWTSSILKAGTGLIKNGATVSLDFVNITGTGLTQNGSQISIDTTGFASSLAGDGLLSNGGTLSVNVGNGLEIVSDTIYLGGTLSQNTITDGQGSYGLIYNGLEQFNVNGPGTSTFSVSVANIYMNSSLNDFVMNSESQFNITSGSTFSIILEGSGVISDISGLTQGLVYAGDYTGTFVTNSLVTKQYVDSAIPNVGATNGISEFGQGIVGIGGTFGQNTTISASSFDFTIQDFDILTLTGSTVDIQLDNGLYLVDAGQSGSIELYGGDVTLFATGSVDIISTNEFTVNTGTGSINTSNLQGLVYTTDYSATFVNNSLITKQYVDTGTSSIWNAIDSINNDYITGITAGNGLSGGGTSGFLTIDVNLGIDSGLTFSGDNIIIDTNIAGNGLDISNGVLTVNTSEITTTLAGNGLTANGSSLDVNVNSDSLEIDGDVIRLKDTITGDRIFQDSVTINGDLTVNGTTSYIYTENLVVEDNFITLNATYSGPYNAINSGIESNLGGGTYASLVWDSNTSLWSAGLSGSVSSIITEAGIGLTKSGNQLSIDTAGFASTLAGDGLTASGGILSVSVDNGLQIVNDVVVLGGTLSQNTLINSQEFDLTFGNVGILHMTSSVFDVESEFISLDSGTGSIQILADSDISIYSASELSLLANSGLVSTTNLEGLVYTSDYSTTFVTYSLITKKYVDDSIATLGSGTINGVTAGAGLTGGGTAGFITIDVNVNNGISIIDDVVVLGGTLSQNTEISANSFDFTISDFENLVFTGSTVDVQLDNGLFIVDVDSGSIDLYSGGLQISSEDVDISANSEFTLTAGTATVTTFNNEGLVYTTDYTGTFVTNSLITKGYVDSLIDSVGATNGLTEYSSGIVGLGGTLSQNTEISANSFDFTISDFGNLVFTGSTVDVQLDNGLFIVDVDNGYIDLYSGELLVVSENVDVIANSEFTLTSGTATVTTLNNEGLVYTSDYTGTFVTNSLITKGYVDSLIDSVGATNGLVEVSSGVIGLGGTLSQNTIIQSDSYDLTIGNVGQLLFTSSIFDVESEFVSIDAGTGSVQILADSDIDVMSLNGELTFIANSNLITINNGEGLVYSSDYSPTFVTNSLVNKAYVDSIISSVGATNGLTEYSSGIVGLGGTLSQSTSIDGNLFSLDIGNVSSMSVTSSTGIVLQTEGIIPGSENRIQVYQSNVLMRSVDFTGSTFSEIKATNNESILYTESSGSYSQVRVSNSPQVVGDLSINNYLLIKDELGFKGLIYEDDYSSNFTTYSLVTKGYVDSAVPNVGADNGLQELSPAVVGLGGTLSQNTYINADSNDLVIGNIGTLLFTASLFDVESSFVSIDAGTGSIQILADNEIDLVSLSGQLTLGGDSGKITIGNLEGLVYTQDYSGTFVSYSLVSKGYVDAGTASIWNAIDSINNDYITGITAGNGLSGGGTSGFVNLDVNLGINSGLTFSSDNIIIDTNIAGTGLSFSDGVLSVISGASQPVYDEFLAVSTSGNDSVVTGVTLSNTPNDYSRIEVYVNGQRQRLGDSLNYSTKDCYFGTSPGFAIDLPSLSTGNQLYWNGIVAGFDLSTTDVIEIVYEK